MIWGTYILGNHIDPYLVWYIQHAPLRRVSFPMGAFGAPTMKMTVTLSGNIDFRFIMFELQLPTHLPPHSLQLHPGTATAGLLRIWSTLDNLGSLRRPISLKLLREALARTEECVCVVVVLCLTSNVAHDCCSTYFQLIYAHLGLQHNQRILIMIATI